MTHKEKSNSRVQPQLHTKKFSHYLPIVFVVFDIICDNVILSSFNKETPIKEAILFFGFLFIQIITAPIQAGLSDHWGRKKSLIIALSITLMSLVVLFFHSSPLFPFFAVLGIGALIKSLAGNTVPIVWGFIGDTDRKDERFFFAMSEAAYAVGFLLLLFFSKILSNNTLICVLILIFSVLTYLCKRYFIDTKDIDCEQKIHLGKRILSEANEIASDLRKKPLRLICLSFLFLEISLYCILILYTDFPNQGSNVAIFMMVGYLLGCGLMKLCVRFSNKAMMRFGFILSTFSLVPYIMISFFSKDTYYLLVGCYFVHSIGNAILSPTVLSEICVGMESHQKGKRFGLLDSSDTIALLAVSLIIIVFRMYQLTIIYMVVFSFLMMIIAWTIYQKYEKSSTHSISNRE